MTYFNDLKKYFKYIFWECVYYLYGDCNHTQTNQKCLHDKNCPFFIPREWDNFKNKLKKFYDK